jgi:hypothetical protein
LNKGYLLRTVKGMWALSTGIFGASQFSYDELAAYLGEHDVKRVKTAARRIATVCRNAAIGPKKPKKAPPSDPLWAGSSSWAWRVWKDGEKCEYLDPEDVKDELDQLVNPCEESNEKE